MPHINSLKKLRLFSFLVVLMFAACKKPGESLGESIQPEEDLLFAQQTDSTPLQAFVMKKEPVRIDLYANYLVGNYVDPVFGTTRCSAVMQLAPSTTSVIPIGKDEVEDATLQIDSVILTMAFQKESYGNNVPMYFVVNELTELLDVNTNYYSDKQVSKEHLNLIEPGYETQETFPDQASLVASDPKVNLRLKMRNELGSRLLMDCPLRNFSEFVQKFNGLVISASTVDGRILSFAAVDTKLTVYYKKITDPQTHAEVGGLSFDFQNSSSCESFTVTDHQYFGTDLAALTTTHELSGNEACFVQSVNGTRIRVDLSGALWLQQIPNVVINKAELVVPYEKDDHFAPIDGISITYQKDSEGYDRIRDSLYAGGGVNKTKGAYSYNISQHLQAIVSGEVMSTDIFLTDNPLIANLYNSNGIRRSVLRGPAFSATDRTRNMRLIITYSN